MLPQIDTAVKTKDGDNRKKVCAGDFVINSRSDRRGSSGISPLDGSVSLINIILQPREGTSYYYHYLLRSHMHESIPETVEKLNKKLVGHYRYYGIYGNWISLKKFYNYVKYELWRTKQRRDQSGWLTWRKYADILRIYPIEGPKVYLTSAY